MNLLYLNSHDTGRSIEPYGCPVQTPALQKLAEEGCLFRNAHCAAPTCSPSRAALLTGQSAHGSGMVGLTHRGSSLKFPERHLANFLKEQGFLTHKSGLSHVGGPDEQHGYLETAAVDTQDGSQIVADAVAFLKQQDGSRPFFLDAGFFDTHRTIDGRHGFSQPFHSPGDGDGNPDYVQVPSSLPDTPETRRDWLDFRHSVERLDRFYGEILHALEASGHAEDTLILVTTDHGIAFPLHKCSLTHRGSGVLLLMRFPGGLGQGRVFDALVSHLDVYPTVCDLLNVPAPEWLEGSSLLPLLRGETDTVREELFTEVTFHGSFEPKRGVRTKRWNYIRNYATPHNTILPNCDNGLSKQLFLDHGWAAHPVASEELYDLMFDPMEQHNLVGSAECGVRSVECGVRSAEREMRSAECGVRNGRRRWRICARGWMRGCRKPTTRFCIPIPPSSPFPSESTPGINSSPGPTPAGTGIKPSGKGFNPLAHRHAGARRHGRSACDPAAPRAVRFARMLRTDRHSG